jgi:hypothetical protein
MKKIFISFPRLRTSNEKKKKNVTLNPFDKDKLQFNSRCIFTATIKLSNVEPFCESINELQEDGNPSYVLKQKIHQIVTILMLFTRDLFAL